MAANGISEKVLARMQKDLAGYTENYQAELDSMVGSILKDIGPIWQGVQQRLVQAINGLYGDLANTEDPQKLNALKYKIKQLQSVTQQVEAQYKAADLQQQQYLTNNIKYAYEKAYYTQAFGLEQATKVSAAVPLLTQNHILSVIANPWLGDGANYSDRLRASTAYLAAKMKQTIRDGVEQGWSANTTALKIRERAGESLYNAVRLARTEYTRAAAQGANYSLMKNADIVDGKRWNAALDKKTAKKDAANDGKLYDIDYDTTEKPGIPGQRIPNHPNCFDVETQVYTDKGWKHFKELEGNEKFFSIDPKTLLPSWVNAVNYIKYLYKGNMIRFKNNSFDCMVTPNHNMLVYNRKAKKGWHFREAQDVPKTDTRFLRGIKWEGIDLEFVEVEGLKIPTELYCKFMGYYLSEGNTIKRVNSYQIKISQRKYSDLFYEDLRQLPVKVCKGRDAIYINGPLAKHTYPMGYSYEKRVPNIIKNLAPQHVKAFLMAYALGDGSIRQDRQLDGYKTKDSITYYSSSQGMVEDIGELILKAGGRPSFTVVQTKGKAVVHKNGTYTTNHDTFIVNWCKHTTAQTGTVKRAYVPYNDYVYCVELEHNHTLLVRRNGKVTWAGNCRCKWLPVLSALGVSDKQRIGRDKDGNRIYTKARTYDEYAKERGLPTSSDMKDNPKSYLRPGETVADLEKNVTRWQNKGHEITINTPEWEKAKKKDAKLNKGDELAAGLEEVPEKLRGSFDKDGTFNHDRYYLEIRKQTDKDAAYSYTMDMVDHLLKPQIKEPSIEKAAAIKYINKDGAYKMIKSNGVEVHIEEDQVKYLDEYNQAQSLEEQRSIYDKLVKWFNGLKTPQDIIPTAKVKREIAEAMTTTKEAAYKDIFKNFKLEEFELREGEKRQLNIDPQGSIRAAALKDAMSKANTWLATHMHPENMTITGLKLERLAKGTRAYAYGKRGTVCLPTDTSAATAVHEAGHCIHEQNDRTKQLVTTWFEKRTAGLDLQTIYSGTTEKGYKDDFISHYVGKVYSWEKENQKGQEVVSMGMQYMYENPKNFYMKDPDHFKLIYAILRGLQ